MESRLAALLSQLTQQGVFLLPEALMGLGLAALVMVEALGKNPRVTGLAAFSFWLVFLL